MSGIKLGFVCSVMLACGSHTPPPSVTLASPPTTAVAPVAHTEHAKDFGCAPFARDGITPDERKARACWETTAAGERCEGSSPPLPILELAVYLVDGIGGPTDIPRARQLLAPCFADASTAMILQHAAAKEKDASTAPLGTCDAFAVTTIAASACLAEHIRNEDAWTDLQRSSLASETRGLFEVATKAHEIYASKLGLVAYALYAGGSLRDPAARSASLSALRKRRTRISHIDMLTAVSITHTMLAQAREQLAKAVEDAKKDASTDLATTIDDAARAWSAYRDAEAAFFARAKPATRDAIVFELTRAFVNDLEGATTR